jgi:hypothetical protein
MLVPDFKYTLEDALKLNVIKYGPLMALALFAASQLRASTIDTFSFTPVSSPFTSNLISSSTGGEATIAGTIACDLTTACSGEVGTFSLGMDLTEPGMVAITTDGSLTGDTPGSGSVNLTSPMDKTRAFNVPLGSFDYTRFTNELPASMGLVTVAGSLDLTLEPGQVLTLPVDIGFVSAVPEPSGQLLIFLAALGLAGFIRYRHLRRAS